jgi:hypothetical protein
MNEFQKNDKINGLIEYFAKSKRNEFAEDAMRDMLSAIPDRDFDKAVSSLYSVSNRWGLDLSAIKSALAEIGASADDGLPAGYERVGKSGIIHKGVEIQCHCCGHKYLWSKTADDQDNAEKDWWAYCPICGFNGDEQAEGQRTIERTGQIGKVYMAMLERQYQNYAERNFEPIKSRAEVKKAYAEKSRGVFRDWKSVQSALIEIEQSHKERSRRWQDRIVQFPNRVAGVL